MNLRHTLILINAAIVLMAFSCGKSRQTTQTGERPAHAGAIVEPDMVKPQVDTRFQQAFFDAMKEKAIGNNDKAYRALEQCLAIAPGSGAVHYELARIDMGRNNMGSALSHTKAALTADPQNAWYHRLLADIYYKQGKFDLAYKSYLNVERLNPDDTEILYAQANCLLSTGKLEEAIKVLDKMERNEGVAEELSMEKHRLYLELRKPDKAEAELRKLAEAYPSEARYWGILLQYLQRTGQQAKVPVVLEKLKNLPGSSGEVHMQLSEYYAATGNDELSYRELVEAFKTTDVDIDQKVGILMKYYTLSEVNPQALVQAYELLEITEKVHPAEAKAFSIYGDFLNREVRYTEARDKYRRAVELDPSRKIIWNEILVIDAQLADYESMTTGSARALELFPGIPEFYYYHGVASYRLGRNEQALESLRAGRELVIENNMLLVQFNSLMGEVYNALKQYEASDECYEAVLRLEPTHAIAMNNYAYNLAVRRQKLDKAYQLSKRSLELDPAAVSFMDTFAWVLYRQGNFNEALVWIEKAMNTAGNDAEVLEHYGDILFRLGRTAEAIARWKDAQNAGAQSPVLKQKITEQRLVD